MRKSNSGSFKIETEWENIQIINSKDNNFIELINEVKKDRII